MVRSLAAPPSTRRPILHSDSTTTTTSTSKARAVPPRVRCPELKHLRIDGWGWSRRALGQILDCLRVRAAHGASRLEYFGSDADGAGWVSVILPVLEKYRTRFLAVVDEFALDGWRW
ncbi:hypothetical protein TRAPUB_12866 [Trametes pubescens]|uniref:Uncharacterized protein n=1 Tax=Trametes pubescens TaxID=154538 RepID=A0A1M2VST4_TRAPU|nr:hypothetical protein TRAPUB_12866 [Trametes pubescens]